MKKNEGNSKSKKIGITQVAKKAGVSPATVSRVFNKTAKVKPEVEQLILKVAAEMGYRPNPHAKALLTGRTGVIGIVITKIDNGFYGPFYRGLEIGLGNKGYRIIIASGEYEADRERAVIEDFIDRDVDGLIVYSVGLSDEELYKYATGNTPMLVMERNIEGIEDQCISQNQKLGGYIATKALIDEGHTKIAHISGPLFLSGAKAREGGYFQALREAGIQKDNSIIITSDYSEDGGYKATMELLSRGGFTAIFCDNDQMALGALAALREVGKKVPEDISLVGFDNIPTAKYVTPSLTTVQQPMKLVGKATAEHLLNIIEGKFSPVELPEQTLIKRNSVCPPKNN